MPSVGRAVGSSECTVIRQTREIFSNLRHVIDRSTTSDTHTSIDDLRQESDKVCASWHAPVAALSGTHVTDRQKAILSGPPIVAGFWHFPEEKARHVNRAKYLETFKSQAERGHRHRKGGTARAAKVASIRNGSWGGGRARHWQCRCASSVCQHAAVVCYPWSFRPLHGRRGVLVMGCGASKNFAVRSEDLEEELAGAGTNPAARARSERAGALREGLDHLERLELGSTPGDIFEHYTLGRTLGTLNLIGPTTNLNKI